MKILNSSCTPVSSRNSITSLLSIPWARGPTLRRFSIRWKTASRLNSRIGPRFGARGPQSMPAPLDCGGRHSLVNHRRRRHPPLVQFQAMRGDHCGDGPLIPCGVGSCAALPKVSAYFAPSGSTAPAMQIQALTLKRLDDGRIGCHVSLDAPAAIGRQFRGLAARLPGGEGCRKFYGGRARRPAPLDV